MIDDVRMRVIETAKYILKTGATVRAAAKRFSVSKTTVHKDMRKRLPDIDRELSEQVDRVLIRNMQERHIRGGMATRRKYKGE